MKTALIFLKIILIIVLSIVLASLFGALHNQISYSVSSEFFKNFLFGNFGVYDWEIKNDRILASLVGILGSYWVGLILGIIYSVIFLFLKTENNFKNILNAILINIGFALVGSFVGYIIGKFISLENSGVFMDFGTQYPQNYIQAAYMHNGSYYGGIVGLIAGIIYLFKKNTSK